MGIIERKEREKEMRREEIIDAAQEIFFTKGLASATMDEIAEKAELSKGTLYLYYKSKEDLYLAVAMRGSDLMYKLFTEATQTERPTLQRIEDLGEAYFEFFKRHRDYFRMYQYLENSQLHKQVSQDMLLICANHDSKIWRLVMDLIQQGVNEGLLDADIDPAQAAIILWSSGNGLMRQIDRDDTYWKEHMKVDLEATMRKSYQLILEGMMTKKGKTKYQAQKQVKETAVS
jgi:TetR/AcrR family transcriptional regulator